MKIFSDLDIVDHTGHGVPIIVSKYGEEAFDINQNNIKVIIPFDKEVIKSIIMNPLHVNKVYELVVQ